MDKCQESFEKERRGLAGFGDFAKDENGEYISQYIVDEYNKWEAAWQAACKWQIEKDAKIISEIDSPNKDCFAFKLDIVSTLQNQGEK